MTRREILERVRYLLQQISWLLDDWQDADRTYTPAERNLAVRLDRRCVPA